MCLDVRDKFVALKEKRIIVRGEYSNTNVTRRFKNCITKSKTLLDKLAKVSFPPNPK
jgi:hypothetical protein